MNKGILKKIGIVVAVIIGIVFLQFLLTSGNNTENKEGKALEASTASIGDVEKIQVVHFHATQQCWSCITVGEFAKKTIEQKFSEEYASGKIEFLNVNAELPENSEITGKFGARGSSLFINLISEGKDNISEEAEVWRLVYDEKAFTDYFESKLRSYL